MREEPEEKREGCAENEAGDDREVESCVFTAVDDVAGEFAEAERELAAEIEKSADEGEEPPRSRRVRPSSRYGSMGKEFRRIEMKK